MKRTFLFWKPINLVPKEFVMGRYLAFAMSPLRSSKNSTPADGFADGRPVPEETM